MADMAKEIVEANGYSNGDVICVDFLVFLISFGIFWSSSFMHLLIPHFLFQL